MQYTINIIPFKDTWSSLTDTLSNYLWGETARGAQPQTQRAADITEQFETLYSRYLQNKYSGKVVGLRGWESDLN